MARYENGINGPVSGKVGTVIGASWRGVAYLKGKHKNSVKTATEAQLMQRSILSLANSWLKPVRDLIWIGFQVFKGTKTPMNGAVSLLMKEAIVVEDGLPRIDFSAVILSRGELLTSWMLELSPLIDAVLYLKWDNSPLSAFNRKDDRAMFVVYNPVKEKFITFSNVALRDDREVNLQLPVSFSGDVLHCYLFYINATGDMVSTSQYLGEVVLK